VRSVSSNTDSGTSASIARKRPPTESLPGNKAKRSRPSQETIEMAARFKQFYARYEQLHHDISKHDNPDPSKVMDLLDMHERLSRMKTEIYAAVEAC
jgi:RNA polymerase II elongation factor ELL